MTGLLAGFVSWFRRGKGDPPAHSSDRLRRYTSWIEKHDLPKIPLATRSFVVQKMRDEIMRTARRDGQIKRDDEGNELSVRPALFTRDIAALNKVLDTMRHSEALNAWLDDRRRALVAHLHETWPPGRLKREWRRQSLHERVRTVSRIMREQCRLYREGAIEFFPSKIMPFKGLSYYQGYTTPDPALIARRAIPSIHINRAVLEESSPFTALETAHHEQIHVFLMQLAAAAARRDMPDDHPLQKDAQIKLSRIFHNAAIPGAIMQSYARDPEEIVCHAQHRKFIDEYRHQPLWQRMRQFFAPPAPP